MSERPIPLENLSRNTSQSPTPQAPEPADMNRCLVLDASRPFDRRRRPAVRRMPRHCIAWILLALVLILPGCAARSNAPKPTASPRGILEVREGLASFYGPGFDGKVTASGARFNMNAMV